MSNSITQTIQKENRISRSVQLFFKRFSISSALKASNAYKKRGIPVLSVFEYLFLLAFSNRSLYMSLVTERNAPTFAKDTLYRFMKSTQIHWMRFTTLVASRIICNAIVPLNKEDRVNVLIIDDSLVERNRSQKVELLAKTFDHSKNRYCFGFRMLTLGWSDGSTFLPVNCSLLSSQQKKNRVREAQEMDKRSLGYKRRKRSMQKATEVMLELLRFSKNASIPAKYVLFDRWFTSPSSLHSVKAIGYDVIAMVRKSSKMFFRYQGQDLPLTKIYERNKKRRGRSRYLLSVDVEVVKDGEVLPAKVVYVRNRNKRNQYLCLISTDTALEEEEIIRIYGKRWDIEVFFKVCKSYLKLGKECRSLSYDAMTAHTAVVFVRYMMLSLERREDQDKRSLGELFLLIYDELSDITWVEAFQHLVEMFEALFCEHTTLCEEHIEELLHTFIDALPAFIKSFFEPILRQNLDN